MIIWLASYPKSGNTWLRMFLRAYFLPKDKKFSINEEGNDDYEAKAFPNIDLLKENKINYNKFEEIVKNWINLQIFINLNNKINFLKTHNGNFNINGYPFTNSKNTIGGIYVVRDPRDVVLSLSNHFNITYEQAFNNMNNMQNYEFYDKNLTNGFRNSIMGTWSSNYNSWRYYQEKKIHLVKYEDMIKKPENTFLEILKYLNLFLSFNIDENKIKEAIKDTSFQNLKEMENKDGFKELGSGDKFFRKGIIGDWEQTLNPQMIKNIETNFQKEMRELDYI
tara:strand:+ start:78 stop:914 length:837 start_codon:yes stop_codon:yes gene_type:complete